MTGDLASHQSYPTIVTLRGPCLFIFDVRIALVFVFVFVVVFVVVFAFVFVFVFVFDG